MNSCEINVKTNGIATFQFTRMKNMYYLDEEHPHPLAYFNYVVNELVFVTWSVPVDMKM